MLHESIFHNDPKLMKERSYGKRQPTVDTRILSEIISPREEPTLSPDQQVERYLGLKGLAHRYLREES